jgi:hypothetical protein
MTLPLPCRERLSDTILRCPTTLAEQRHSIAAKVASVRSGPRLTGFFVSLFVSLPLQVLDFQWRYYRFEPCIAHPHFYSVTREIRLVFIEGKTPYLPLFTLFFVSDLPADFERRWQVAGRFLSNFPEIAS